LAQKKKKLVSWQIECCSRNFASAISRRF